MDRGSTTLALEHISKQFAGLAALDDVSLVASPGEVHALLGENGAGKSTLMRIVYGLLQPDAGQIMLSAPGRQPRRSRGFASPRAARLAGIGMVHQHFTSIPAFTVSENIALTAGWSETGRQAEQRAAELIARTGLGLDVRARASSLSAQLRQRLEIVKALAGDAGILLLDEPTAVLAPPEVDELLDFLRAFAARGGTVMLITHKLDEAFRVAGQVTVLRHGRVTLADRIPRHDRAALVHAMIGYAAAASRRRTGQLGPALVVADHVDLGRTSDSVDAVPQPARAIRNATFDVHSGELVGVAAVDGNGQRELLRGIAAVDDVTLLGGRLDVAAPAGFIPEDRSTEGLIPSFTVAENLLLGSLDRAPWWLDWRAIRERARRILLADDIRAAGPDVPAATLSGGNQQKVVVAMAMSREPRVIVAEDPSRGLDVHAADTIHARLQDVARSGAAVIVHASDVDEVLGIADRVLVVAHGGVSDLGCDPSRETVGAAMLAPPS